MSFNQDTVIHLIAGGCGGTMGAIATCPLEVVKTRLQASTFSSMGLPLPAAANPDSTTCKSLPHCASSRKLCTSAFNRSHMVNLSHQFSVPPSPRSPRTLSLYHCLRYIIRVEGPWALWRGLGPNLVGVAPSRAVYFCSYSQTKKILVLRGNFTEGPTVHILSAISAGFTACSLTNPIWMVKTRLQLDHSKFGRPLTATDCILRVYREGGIVGFYKGLTASYYGIAETVIHLVIYEAIKARLQEHRHANPNSKTGRDFMEYMGAGAISKTVASSLCYPHEVARTRLREEGKKYSGFWQTLALVFQEEGFHGLYRGLTTQLVRQIPNTAIMMATYEGVVYFLSRYCKDETFYEDYENEETY